MLASHKTVYTLQYTALCTVRTEHAGIPRGEERKAVAMYGVRVLIGVGCMEVCSGLMICAGGKARFTLLYKAAQASTYSLSESI